MVWGCVMLGQNKIATQEWKRKNVDGIEPRCFFSAVLHDQSLHIFGGSNICYFSLEGLYYCDLGLYLFCFPSLFPFPLLLPRSPSPFPFLLFPLLSCTASYHLFALFHCFLTISSAVSLSLSIPSPLSDAEEYFRIC